MRKPKHSVTKRLFLAVEGLIIALRRERHMKVHMILAILLIPPLAFVDTSNENRWILVILIVLLIILELINTAIEITVDLVTRRFRYRAKLAKDMSSGAVLMAGVLVLIFSIFIYGPGVYNFTMGVLLGY
jgi:diacylglycerol kinase